MNEVTSFVIFSLVKEATSFLFMIIEDLVCMNSIAEVPYLNVEYHDSDNKWKKYP